MITAKVVQIPGAVTEVMLEDGATVSDALTAANITVQSGYAVKVDGSDVDNSTPLTDGARIIVAKSAKGNI